MWEGKATRISKTILKMEGSQNLVLRQFVATIINGVVLEEGKIGQIVSVDRHPCTAGYCWVEKQFSGEVVNTIDFHF